MVSSLYMYVVCRSLTISLSGHGLHVPLGKMFLLKLGKGHLVHRLLLARVQFLQSLHFADHLLR